MVTAANAGKTIDTIQAVVGVGSTVAGIEKLWVMLTIPGLLSVATSRLGCTSA